MKTFRSLFLVVLALAVGAARTSSQVAREFVSKEPARDNAAQPREQVKTLDRAPEGESITRFVGRSVRSEADDELGSIGDLLADAYSGRIAYAAVVGPSGSGVRLVPFGALKAQGDGFAVTISGAEWKALAPVSARAFEEGRIPLSNAERIAIAEHFARQDPSGSSSHLVRLATLRGTRVSTVTEQVGAIGDIMIDAGRRTGAAVIVGDTVFAGGGRRYLVALPALNLASRERNPLLTFLNRTDFERAADSPGAAIDNATKPR